MASRAQRRMAAPVLPNDLAACQGPAGRNGLDSWQMLAERRDEFASGDGMSDETVTASDLLGDDTLADGAGADLLLASGTVADLIAGGAASDVVAAPVVAPEPAAAKPGKKPPKPKPAPVDAVAAEAVDGVRDEMRDAIDPATGMLTEEAQAIRRAEAAPPAWAVGANPDNATPSVTGRKSKGHADDES